MRPFFAKNSRENKSPQKFQQDWRWKHLLNTIILTGHDISIFQHDPGRKWQKLNMPSERSTSWRASSCSSSQGISCLLCDPEVYYMPLHSKLNHTNPVHTLPDPFQYYPYYVVKVVYSIQIFQSKLVMHYAFLIYACCITYPTNPSCHHCSNNIKWNSTICNIFSLRSKYSPQRPLLTQSQSSLNV
jgi:hypothetical protein